MNRRDFIRSLFATLAAALVPRKFVNRRAMGGPVPKDAPFIIGNGDKEIFTPNTEWIEPHPRIAFKHTGWTTEPISEADLRALYDYWKTSRHIPG